MAHFVIPHVPDGFTEDPGPPHRVDAFPPSVRSGTPRQVPPGDELNLQ